MQNDASPDGVQLSAKIDGYISKALKADLFKHRAFDPHNLKRLSRYMTVIAVLMALYLIIDILMVKPSRSAVSMISGSSASGVTQPLAQSAMPLEMKGYAYYSNKISGRNIFTANAYTETDGLSGTGEPADDSIGLVGIIPGNDPQAIIEDKKSQQTYYLKKGQAVNGITVEDIDGGRVSLDCRGKKMTLLL